MIEARMRKSRGNVFILVCGLLAIGLTLFVALVNSEMTAGAAVVPIGSGVLLCLIGLTGMRLSRRACLRIGDGRVTADNGFGKRLDCRTEDIEFVWAQGSALTLLLKNGRRYIAYGVKYADELGAMLLRHIPFAADEAPERTAAALKAEKAARKKELIAVCVCAAWMVVNIPIAVLLTGGREWAECSTADRTILLCMAAAEVAVMAVTFWLADRAGRRLLSVQRLSYRIRRGIIESAPLLPGNAVRVLADDHYTGRMTLFGFPNSSSVYYTVELLNAENELVKMHESEVYDDLSAPDTEGMTDITETVLKSSAAANDSAPH